jgi:hypothetical protein
MVSFLPYSLSGKTQLPWLLWAGRSAVALSCLRSNTLFRLIVKNDKNHGIHPPQQHVPLSLSEHPTKAGQLHSTPLPHSLRNRISCRVGSRNHRLPNPRLVCWFHSLPSSCVWTIGLCTYLGYYTEHSTLLQLQMECRQDTQRVCVIVSLPVYCSISEANWLALIAFSHWKLPACLSPGVLLC